MNNDEMQAVIEELKKRDDFIITAHVNPEGDSVGSQLAFFSILKKIGKNAVMLSQDDVPDNLRFLAGSDLIRSAMPEGFRPAAAVVLDCPVIERVGVIQKYLEDRITVINVDHHVSNEMYGDVSWVEPKMSSVGEMAYHVFKNLGITIDSDAARAMYAAIVTDTGMFNYNNTSGGTHRVVGDLIDKGISPGLMHREIFEEKPMMQIKMLGKVLTSTQVEENGLLAYVTLTRKMQEEDGVTNIATDEFINYPRSIKGVAVAVFFKEGVNDGSQVSVSFRSNGRINVNEVAAGFGGGGHKNAAGCLMYCDLAEATRKVLDEVKRFIREKI
ncbi:MAG: bifunctional oligoribonuclease/PAP phosphatase NrnA [Candidatus Omnitrophica bacterium]|nr:bifunctional oligoribonuclease/PAP phosphatase NrnA [Candidatus Omnitrophota bacterium]